MKREELQSKLNKSLCEDRIKVFGDPSKFMQDPFCLQCGSLLKDDEQINCRRCARIRIHKS
jgi:hypothetical protein